MERLLYTSRYRIDFDKINLKKQLRCKTLFNLVLQDKHYLHVLSLDFRLIVCRNILTLRVVFMAVLKVLTFPDDRLRTVAKPVALVDDDIRKLVDDMFETMRDEKGIGLAATQVNVHKRVVVMDVSEEQNEPRVFINPEITHKNGETVSEEGCLSVPNNYAKIDRAEHITVKALNKQGEEFELEAEGLLAICIQHELDHLEGKLFVDYLSSLKRDRIRKKLEKESKLISRG